jgi:hypothetical protein
MLHLTNVMFTFKLHADLASGATDAAPNPAT